MKWIHAKEKAIELSRPTHDIYKSEIMSTQSTNQISITIDDISSENEEKRTKTQKYI